jgi:hypothetical protein
MTPVSGGAMANKVCPIRRDDLWQVVRNAPKSNALDGSILVDLAFVCQGLETSIWWPLADLVEGYLPLEATKLWL